MSVGGPGRTPCMSGRAVGMPRGAVDTSGKSHGATAGV